MKRKSILTLLVTITICFAAGCGEDANTTTSTAPAPETTPGATDEVETTEAEPAETVVEEISNNIDGVDFTGFNEGEVSIDYVIHEMAFDEPKVIVTKGDEAEAKALTILSGGDHFTQQEGRYTYYVYTPKAVKTANFYVDKMDVDADGVAVMRKNIEIKDGYVWEEDGVQYTSPYTFWYNDDALVTDDSVYMAFEYEDGTVNTLAVYVTKDYVIE